MCRESSRESSDDTAAKAAAGVEPSSKWRKYGPYGLVVVVLLGVIGALLAVFVPSSSSSSSSSSSDCPATTRPTNPFPTVSPEHAAFAEMMDYAETKSSRCSLWNTTSPQYMAVEWLTQDKVDNGSNWSGYELLQRYVLRVLYESTNGKKWYNSAPFIWFGASSVCQWQTKYRLYCNGNGQQVDRIVLGDDNLQGEIPDELGQLTALTRLELDRNQLTGTIPSQLGKLTALTYLSLSYNDLTGTIPSQLGQLTALTKLYLRYNNLTGQVPSEFCAAPFPDWGAGRATLWADCRSEVQCDCCNECS